MRRAFPSHLYGPPPPVPACRPLGRIRVWAGHLAGEEIRLTHPCTWQPLMTTEQTGYHPISCEFHDLLEDLATLRRSAKIGFRDESGLTQHRDAVITDLFARDGAEYASLSTGEILRLDRLVEVNGARLADYGESSICAL